MASAALPNDAPISEVERIAILEERSRHAATKAELHRALLMLFIALITTMGGLMIHLHNSSLNEIAEMRAVLFEVLQRLPG